MPTGVYYRSPELMKTVRQSMDAGRTPQVRAKVNEILRTNAQDPLWKDEVASATKKAMHDPEIRKRHLQGLLKARQIHGVNFKGGNGQESVGLVKQILPLLSQIGFIQEYPIKTKLVKHLFPSAATAYKADFANPTEKIVMEIDGCTHGRNSVTTDMKKTRVLTALGWTVLRCRVFNPCLKSPV